MDYPIARKYALRLLSMRNYHTAVLRRKMGEKGFSEESVERVIEDCQRLGFLKDDEAILREFRRGYGPRYVEYKLRLKKEEVRGVITRAMQREKVKELREKLGPGEKSMRTLQRKGFDSDIIVEIFSYRGVD